MHNRIYSQGWFCFHRSRRHNSPSYIQKFATADWVHLKCSRWGWYILSFIKNRISRWYLCRFSDFVYPQTVQLTIRDLLIIWLLTEKKKQDSKYFGYIQSLPETSTCPFRRVFTQTSPHSSEQQLENLNKQIKFSLAMLAPTSEILPTKTLLYRFQTTL